MKKNEILKMTGAGAATLNRWIRAHPKVSEPDPNSLAGHPFPAPELMDGRALVWDDDAVIGWWRDNKSIVGRHTEDRPVVTIPGDSFVEVMARVRGRYEEEKETAVQYAKRMADFQLIRSIDVRGEDPRLTFDSIGDAVYFKLKYA